MFFKLICFQLLQQTLNCEDKFSGNNRLIRVIYTKKNNGERSEFSVSDQHTHEENISWLALCKLKQCSYMTTRDMRHEMFKKFPIVVSCCRLFYFIFFFYCIWLYIACISLYVVFVSLGTNLYYLFPLICIAHTQLCFERKRQWYSIVLNKNVNVHTISEYYYRDKTTMYVSYMWDPLYTWVFYDDVQYEITGKAANVNDILNRNNWVFQKSFCARCAKQCLLVLSVVK